VIFFYVTTAKSVGGEVYAPKEFSTTAYDWLVIAGPNAKYKGSGTINGVGNYGFMLTARDGQVNGGGGVDRFRIKIWDKDANDAFVYGQQTRRC